MILKICNKEFDTKNINSILIKSREVFIDTNEDFLRLPYSTQDDIREAEEWLKFKQITEKQIMDAATTIMLICDYHMNQYEQCIECPLERDYGCLIQIAPMNWRKDVTGTNEVK